MKRSLGAANIKPEDAAEAKNWEPNANLDKIIGQLKGNINLIFTNGDLGEVKACLDKEVRPSGAKPGMIAPGDVTVPAGATGLDPKQTNFFQVHQIQTKIVKGQVEIVTAKQVIFVGEKITSSQAVLLDKLKIYPFEYKMVVRKILQDGNIFDAAVLDLSVDNLLAKFKNACRVQASLSLGTGFATSASAPHSILNGFKNLVAACAESGYEFKEGKALLEAAKNAPAAGAAGAGPAKVEAVEEKKEEVEDVDMGGLFGADEDEY